MHTQIQGLWVSLVHSIIQSCKSSYCPTRQTCSQHIIMISGTETFYFRVVSSLFWVFNEILTAFSKVMDFLRITVTNGCHLKHTHNERQA